MSLYHLCYIVHECVHAKLLQSCPTLCDPMDGSLPGSSVHGIFQARILEWVAISFSRRSSQPRDQSCLSSVSCIGRWDLHPQRHLESPYYITKVKVKSDSVSPWAVAHQTPPSMGFFRQEYWSGLPFPSPGDLPDPGIEPGSPALQVDALPSEPPGKSLLYNKILQNLVTSSSKYYIS